MASMVGFFCQYSAHRAPIVANHFRKICPPTQRVVVMEGGFRGWEAQELPVENRSPQLSQAAYDNLALKMGSELLSLSQVRCRKQKARPMNHFLFKMQASTLEQKEKTGNCPRISCVCICNVKVIFFGCVFLAVWLLPSLRGPRKGFFRPLLQIMEADKKRAEKYKHTSECIIDMMF